MATNMKGRHVLIYVHKKGCGSVCEVVADSTRVHRARELPDRDKDMTDCTTVQ